MLLIVCHTFPQPRSQILPENHYHINLVLRIKHAVQPVCMLLAMYKFNPSTFNFEIDVHLVFQF